jgi:hypothetical protein
VTGPAPLRSVAGRALPDVAGTATLVVPVTVEATSLPPHLLLPTPPPQPVVDTPGSHRVDGASTAPRWSTAAPPPRPEALPDSGPASAVGEAPSPEAPAAAGPASSGDGGLAAAIAMLDAEVFRSAATSGRADTFGPLAPAETAPPATLRRPTLAESRRRGLAVRQAPDQSPGVVEPAESRPGDPRRVEPVEPSRAVVEPREPERGTTMAAEPVEPSDTVPEPVEAVGEARSTPSRPALEPDRATTVAVGPVGPVGETAAAPPLSVQEPDRGTSVAVEPVRAPGPLAEPAEPAEPVAPAEQLAGTASKASKPQQSGQEPDRGSTVAVQPVQPSGAVVEPVQPVSPVVEPVEPVQRPAEAGSEAPAPQPGQEPDRGSTLAVDPVGPSGAAAEPVQPATTVVERVEPTEPVAQPAEAGSEASAPQPGQEPGRGGTVAVDPVRPSGAVVQPVQPLGAVTQPVEPFHGAQEPPLGEEVSRPPAAAREPDPGPAGPVAEWVEPRSETLPRPPAAAQGPSRPPVGPAERVEAVDEEEPERPGRSPGILPPSGANSPAPRPPASQVESEPSSSGLATVSPIGSTGSPTGRVAATGAPGGVGAASGVGGVPAGVVGSFARMTGIDLGFVPVVRTPGVEARAASLNARAFTSGGIVHLPEAAGPLDRADTEALVAHELAHVVQQRALGGQVREHDALGERLESVAQGVEAAYRGRRDAATVGDLLSGEQGSAAQLTQLPDPTRLPEMPELTEPTEPSPLTQLTRLTQLTQRPAVTGAPAGMAPEQPLSWTPQDGFHLEPSPPPVQRAVVPDLSSPPGADARPVEPPPVGFPDSEAVPLAYPVLDDTDLAAAGGAAGGAAGAAAGAPGGEARGEGATREDEGRGGLDDLDEETLNRLAARLGARLTVSPLDTRDPELLDQLAGRLYGRLRSGLRRELISDRERVGLLTEFH